jgi:hypothetical protein
LCVSSSSSSSLLAGHGSKSLEEADLPKEASTFRPLLMGVAAGNKQNSKWLCESF